MLIRSCGGTTDDPYVLHSHHLHLELHHYLHLSIVSMATKKVPGNNNLSSWFWWGMVFCSGPPSRPSVGMGTRIYPLSLFTRYLIVGMLRIPLPDFSLGSH
jgi:hypothetical protein